MTLDPYHMARIAGGVAKAAGQRLSDNPYRRGRLLWFCWRVGFAATVSGETVPRETLKSEWSAADRALLQRCIEAEMDLKLAAEVVGRSHAAARIMASRMARRAA